MLCRSRSPAMMLSAALRRRWRPWPTRVEGVSLPALARPPPEPGVGGLLRNSLTLRHRLSSFSLFGSCIKNPHCNQTVW